MRQPYVSLSHLSLNSYINLNYLFSTVQSKQEHKIRRHPHNVSQKLKMVQDLFLSEAKE